MAGLTPLPPSVLHTSTRLTHREAHTFLSTYLERSENDPAYRPDSTLSERGPISSSKGAAQNLTLHHLKRILLGLEGKRVGGMDFLGTSNPKRKFREDGDQEKASGEKRKRRSEIITVGEQESMLGAQVDVPENDDDWQDKDDYEHAQEDGLLDLMHDQTHPGGVDPQHGEALEQPLDEDEEEDMVNLRIEDTGAVVNPLSRDPPERKQQQRLQHVDKDTRRKQKKERRKEERKAKNG